MHIRAQTLLRRSYVTIPDFAGITIDNVSGPGTSTSVDTKSIKLWVPGKPATKNNTTRNSWELQKVFLLPVVVLVSFSLYFYSMSPVRPKLLIADFLNKSLMVVCPLYTAGEFITGGNLSKVV